jgi:threonine dehydratase
MPGSLIEIPTLKEIHAASELLAPHIVRTPLLRLNLHNSSAEIYLKLENLQPIGVFKVRSMGNVLLSAGRDTLKNGVYTASSGNAGIGLAWMAAKLGLQATVYTPESGPQGKLLTMREFGAEVKVMSDEDWWQLIQNSGHPDDPGFYVDAVRSPAAMAGNGTMGLEIIEQLPDVDAIIVPFGGGGVACGIGAAIAEMKPDTDLIVAEAESAAPVTAALKQGEAVTVATQPSFISGAGAPCVLKEMWPLVSTMVNDTIVLPVADVINAVRILYELNHVVAEGAGALPIAAALSSQAPAGKTVCVVTGGNIDRQMMANILLGKPL